MTANSFTSVSIDPPLVLWAAAEVVPVAGRVRGRRPRSRSTCSPPTSTTSPGSSPPPAPTSSTASGCVPGDLPLLEGTVAHFVCRRLPATAGASTPATTCCSSARSSPTTPPAASRWSSTPASTGSPPSTPTSDPLSRRPVTCAAVLAACRRSADGSARRPLWTTAAGRSSDRILLGCTTTCSPLASRSRAAHRPPFTHSTRSSLGVGREVLRRMVRVGLLRPRAQAACTSTRRARRPVLLRSQGRRRSSYPSAPWSPTAPPPGCTASTCCRPGDSPRACRRSKVFQLPGTHPRCADHGDRPAASARSLPHDVRGRPRRTRDHAAADRPRPRPAHPRDRALAALDALLGLGRFAARRPLRELDAVPRLSAAWSSCGSWPRSPTAAPESPGESVLRLRWLRRRPAPAPSSRSRSASRHPALPRRTSACPTSASLVEYDGREHGTPPPGRPASRPAAPRLAARPRLDRRRAHAARGPRAPGASRRLLRPRAGLEAARVCTAPR